MLLFHMKQKGAILGKVRVLGREAIYGQGEKASKC